MFKSYIAVLFALFVSATSMSASSWPNEPLSKSAKDRSFVLLLASAAQIIDGDLESGLSILNKLIDRVNGFNEFYDETYFKFSGAERLSPYEISRMIDGLTKIENLFSSLTNKKVFWLLMNPNDAMAFEIAALKNTILLRRLSIELNGIFEAPISNPEKHKIMFENVDMNKVIKTEDALKELSFAITRLTHLEAKAKSCFALF